MVSSMLVAYYFWTSRSQAPWEKTPLMHISEGVLSAPVLVTGAVMAAAGSALGLRKMDYERMPQVAMLSAAFFVASLVHVPIGPSSVHLVLNGLIGLLLGWAAFPAVLVGLILQALLFQYGGLTTLGVNGAIMATPAVICFYLFGRVVRSEKSAVILCASFLCGAGAVFLSSLIVGLALFSTGEQFLPVAKLVVLAHVPVMVIEGLITAFCVKFFKRVKPEILEVAYGP